MSTFTAASAAEIRDLALADWRARYLALSPPRDLDVTEGSPAYNEIDALSLEFEGVAIGAQEAARRVLLRYASGTDLDLFAEDDGTARKAATTSRRDVLVNGPISASTPVGSATLSTATGARFQPINPTTGANLTAIDTDASGDATILVQCIDAGTGGNIAVGTLLTWSTAPTGFASTGEVVTGAPSRARTGAAVESNTDLRERLLERRRERPASGNRADWSAWAGDVAGVGRGFVYSRAMRTGSSSPYTWRLEQHGCIVVLPVTPAPEADSYVQDTGDGSIGAGLDPSYSRVPSTSLCTNIAGYVKGTLDANGVAVPDADQVQLFAATLDPDNILVTPPDTYEVDVQVSVTTDPAAYPWPWGVDDAPYRTITVAGSTTVFTLDDASGIEVDSLMAIQAGADVIRGRWWLARVLTVVGNVVTLSAAMPSAPSVSGKVRPDCGLWSDVRAAILALFDSLGPGDARATPGGAVSIKSARYPRPSTTVTPEKLYVSKLIDRISNVTGVVDVAIDLPAANVSPETGVLVVPGAIEVRYHA